MLFGFFVLLCSCWAVDGGVAFFRVFDAPVYRGAYCNRLDCHCRHRHASSSYAWRIFIQQTKASAGNWLHRVFILYAFPTRRSCLCFFEKYYRTNQYIPRDWLNENGNIFIRQRTMASHLFFFFVFIVIWRRYHCLARFCPLHYCAMIAKIKIIKWCMRADDASSSAASDNEWRKGWRGDRADDDMNTILIVWRWV